MALQATHFCIARDLAAELGITDLNAYFTGTLYPDSRYVTGIMREQTHGPTCPHNPITAATDFEKGWAVHLRYDELVGEWQKTFIPNGEKLSMFYDNAWIHFTAAKLAEDLASCERLGSALSEIQFNPTPIAPHQENLELLRQHYELVHTLYANGIPTLEGYLSYFSGRIPHEAAVRLVSVSEALLKNDEQRTLARSYYDQARDILIRG